MKRLLALFAALSGASLAADLASPAQTFRASLADAQLELSFDPQEAGQALEQAERAYRRDLKPALEGAAPGAAQSVEADLSRARAALTAGNEVGFAVARTNAWTTLLGGAYQALEASVQATNLQGARQWLGVREYRGVNRFTRLNADATVALQELGAGKITSAEALTSVRADLLDAYQARLADSLTGLKADLARGYRVRAAEQAALARGYFAILTPSFRQQRGASALQQAEATFAKLPASLSEVSALTGNFRAAPLSAREQLQRAGQVARYLKLVPVEYARGVTDAGKSVVVKRDLEVTEARTFLKSAAGAYGDLAPLLNDRANANLARQDFAALQAALDEAALHQNPPSPAEVETRVGVLSARLDALFPAEWKRHDAGGDLDVIRAQLTAVQNAVAAGDYGLAGAARIDAYATLEGGPEARIAVFAPELKLRLENLFWNGESPKGLARLIRERGDVGAFQKTRAALDAALSDTGKLLGTDVAPAAVATNAGVIVFREGLEAVLILAALMGSLRKKEVLHLRRPMWWGAAGAFVASVLTWLAMQGTLTLFARYGEKLSAVVSVIAIAVLLVIMNWFFHNVYWTDRMAGFQQQKHRLMGKNTSQWVGLAVLGFTSIYREGFETVLFLQSLVLSSGTGVVLVGTGLGLLAVFGVGLLVFLLQARLPMKKLLVYTGGMICAVLFVMVGNTVHVLQLVGWLPVHALPFDLPAWLGLWVGLYATWEGALLQAFAVAAVIGSYFLSEGLKERQLRRKLEGTPAHR